MVRIKFVVPTALLTATLAACGREAPPPPPPPLAAPDIQTREVEYRQGETVLKGFVAWDASRSDRRPGVLVVHEWWGENEHSRHQARRLAEAGYVGFALDMYGNGKATTHPDSAAAFMNAALSDPAAMNARFNAALEQLKADPHVDPERIAAIGYCFGGAVVLGQAQAGADLDAVVSFHGAMPPTQPIDSGSVKARILILAGGADPMAPPDQVTAFAGHLKAAGATVGLVSYPGVKHGFTNPMADSVGMDGLGYDANADRQSWDALVRLFSDVFPEPAAPPPS